MRPEPNKAAAVRNQKYGIILIITCFLTQIIILEYIDIRYTC